MLNRPFKQKVGALDFLDERSRLNSFHSVAAAVDAARLREPV